MRTFFFGLVIPTGLLALGIWSFIALGKAEPKKVPAPSSDVAARLALLPEAAVESVKLLADYSPTLDITVSGTVVPFRQINIATEVDGKAVFKAPEARAGNFVRKGHVLYRIDPRDYELAVQRLESMLEQEQATIKELDQDVANANRMIAVNKEEMALHDANLKRLQSLRDGVASRAEIDEVKRARLVSVNAATTLANQLQTFETRRTRMDLAKKLATNQLEQAKLNLSRCEICAPVDGIITTENAQADSYTRKGETLAVLEDLESVEVQCNLRVDQLMWVLDQQTSPSTGQVAIPPAGMAYALPRTPVTIEYKVSGREDLVYRWQGHLDRYDGSGMDPQSRTVPCRVVVDEPTVYKVNGQTVDPTRGSGLPALVRGMFVDVIIAAKPSRVLLLVPKLGVKPGNIIWKFDPNSEAIPPVKTSPNDQPKDKPPVASAGGEESGQGSSAGGPTAKPPLKPEEWDAGYLKILTKINVLHPFSISGPDGQERSYWICEVNSGAVQAGDKVVVSPLSAMVGDGTDGLRVRKEQKP